VDVAAFWRLIDNARTASSGDVNKEVELLIEMLSQQPETEILSFEKICFERLDQAYRADLWEVADVINCGCSDSGFLGFRGWLIAQGEIIFENALRDPESLVDLVEPETRHTILNGRLLSVPNNAYKRRTGQEIPLIVYGHSELIGEVGGENERLKKFPRVAAKLGECDD
jgi:hypothetical protein